MATLRAGGSAIDAIEISVKILEDREITNAGYGSNLAMDGVVECDAVVVDHHGRSGAAGAVARGSHLLCLECVVLTRRRDQEPDLSSPTSLGSYEPAAKLETGTSKSAGWTRRD